MSLQKSIATSILTGIETANKKYKLWSNGYWLSDSGVENIMQSYVADACFKAVKVDKLHVHPEGNLRGFFSRDKLETRRVDILIADRDEKPHFIVELKRNGEGYERDAGKIYDALIGYRHRSERRIKAAYWGSFVVWNERKRKCRSMEEAIEAVKKKFYKEMHDSRLYINWHDRQFPHMTSTDAAGRDLRWECAALVAIINRKE